MDHIIQRTLSGIRGLTPPPSSLLFWVCSLSALILSILVIIAFVIRLIYKVGFYGKGFNTKHDYWHKLVVAKDGVINTDSKPEWSRYCDVSKTKIMNGDAVSDKSDIADDITSLCGRKYVNGWTTTREVSYVVSHYRDDSCSSPLCVLFATPATLVLPNSVALPIYSLDWVGERGMHTSTFQTCFATLHFFQQSNTPQAQVSLFKSKKLLWNVVPLCVFDEVVFRIDKSLEYKFDAGKALRFFAAAPDNIRSITEFVDRESVAASSGKGEGDGGGGWKGSNGVVITKELTDVITLIDSKLLVVVGCSLKGTMIGVLFFVTRPSSQADKTMELCGSVFTTEQDNLRLACFSRALVLANRRLNADSVIIPGLGHNKSILDAICKRGMPATSRTTAAYYLRNYRTSEVRPDKCLILA